MGTEEGEMPKGRAFSEKCLGASDTCRRPFPDPTPSCWDLRWSQLRGEKQGAVTGQEWSLLEKLVV